MTLRIGSLCSGYGGLEQGLTLAGWPVDLAWYAELDPDASAVMAKHHPGVGNLGDITTADWSTAEPVDVLAAGYPCQSFSNAGKRKGWDDERAIWPYVADAVRHLRPRILCVENVSAHLVRGFPDVLGDLATLGYDAQWTCIRASDVGAPHQRDRLFALAYPADADSSTVRGLAVRDGAHGASAVAGDDREGLGGVDLLPTPTAREMHGASRSGREGGANLRTAVAETLLPTPLARLGDDRGLPSAAFAEERMASGRSNLDDAGPRTNHDGWTLCHVAHAGRWGRYTAAIERWERITSRVAPDPTEPGVRGGPRLSARFVEWMMSLPDGYVTDVLPRNAALRVLGNGVVPPQAAAAFRALAGVA